MEKYLKYLSDFWPLVTAIILFLIIYVLCITISVPKIENTLQKRSSGVLTGLNTKFAKVEVGFSGRDAHLTGEVTSEDLNKLVGKLIERVSGVRVVKNALQVSKTCALASKNSQALQAELDALATKHSQIPLNADNIDPQEFADYLQDVARSIRRYEQMSIVILGHADSNLSGYKLTLSQARVQAVHEVLIAKGLSAKCLSARVEEKQSLTNDQISEGQNYIKFLAKELE